MTNRWAAWIAATGLALFAAMPAMPVMAAAPAVTLSAASLDFGSAAWLQPAPTQTLTVTNTGDAALAVQSANITGQPFVPEDFLVSNDQCSSSFNTIAPGAQCQITITFRPQSGGPRSATMLIYDNAADSPQSVSLSGRGTGGVIMFSPQQLDFGTVLVQTTSAPMTFMVANAGDGPVAISKAAIDSAFATSGFAISQDGCSTKTLGPGQRCAISATASPPSIAQSAFAQVDIFDNVGTGEQKYSLGASGGGPLLTILALSQSSFNQGVGTTSAASRFQAFASGTQQIVISSVGLDNSAAGFKIVSDTCSGTTLALGAPFSTPPTCEVDAVFSPPAVGSFSANVVFHDNEFGGSHSQLLSGTGFAPVAVLSTTAIDFGLQAAGTSSAPQGVTVTNPSPQPLTVTSAVLSGSGASYFHLSSDTCTGATVASSGSCSVGIVFSPPFPFVFSATLSISDGAPGSPQTVSLTGEGQGTAFSMSTSHLSFGNLHGNVASASQSITLTNTSATAMSYGHLINGPGTVSGCTTPVNPGASCTLSVSITPNAIGPQIARLSIGDSANNVQFVQVDWNGISGYAFLTNGLVNNQLIQRAGTSVSVTAVVSNGGTDVLNIGSVSLTGTPPAAIAADNCSNKALPAGGLCTFLVTATPTVAGSWFTTLTVPTDAIVGPNPATIPIYGWVAAPTQPVFAPASLTFPPQQLGAAESTQIVWLIDGLVPSLGAQVTTISSVVLGGPDAASFRIVWDGCTGLPVLPAYSCPVAIGFDPKAARALNATLTFNDDAVGSPQVLSLSGVGLAPALVSVAVTPANSSLAKGLNRQFKAIGTYSDGSTADLTGSSTWTSSVATVATISPSGLAHAVKLGTTTITATDGSVSGSTGLTVIAADKPLTITSIGAASDHLDAVAGVTFTDADPNGNLAQYSATINWGDHSTPSAADVAKNPSGGFAAGGSHHYTKSGVYTITVTVKDVGGATVSKSTRLAVS
jgi:hypothetical protein